jgi:4-hydroxy-tetrahydrodipicolinate synthase
MSAIGNDHPLSHRHSWPHGIWAAVPTPFREDSSLDVAGIRHNSTRYRALGLAGIFCNGLMGEGWSLSIAERREIVETMIQSSGGALPIGVVTTHGSIAETLALSRHASGCGADHIVLMRSPGLFAPEELTDLVRMIADAVSCRIVLFDSEAQSGGYPAAVIRQLAIEGRIHGVKCTRNGDAIASLRAECGDVTSICDPYENHALANLVRFDHRTLYADPEPFLYQLPGRRFISDYFEAHARTDHATMLSRHAELEPLRRVYERWIQGPLMRGHPINAALKHWCRRLGLAAGPVRPPLRALTSERARALDAELDEAFRAAFGALPEVVAESSFVTR